MSIAFSKSIPIQNTKDHYKFEDYSSGFRVISMAGTYAFLGIAKNEFEQIYNKYWNSIKVDCKPEKINNKEILFEESELILIKQKIILHWMYFYIVNKMKVKINASDLKHPQTWNIVRNISEEKFGKSKISDIIAANTIGIDIEEYNAWKNGQELFENR